MTSTGDRRLLPRAAGAAAMTLVEHLQELRQRLFVCVGTVFAGAAVSFVYRDTIFGFIRPRPLSPDMAVRSRRW